MLDLRGYEKRAWHRSRLARTASAEGDELRKSSNRGLFQERRLLYRLIENSGRDDYVKMKGVNFQDRGIVSNSFNAVPKLAGTFGLMNLNIGPSHLTPNSMSFSCSRLMHVRVGLSFPIAFEDCVIAGPELQLSWLRPMLDFIAGPLLWRLRLLFGVKRCRRLYLYS